MSKLLNFLMAAALALTVSGFAVAQNQPTDPAQSGATNTPPAMSEEGSAGKQAEGDAINAPQAKSEEGTAGKQAESDATNAPQAKSEEGTAGKQAEGDATNAPQAKSEEETAGKQAESDAAAAPSEEYTAALKKCDSLTGTDKSKCVDAAKKKHGQI